MPTVMTTCPVCGLRYPGEECPNARLGDQRHDEAFVRITDYNQGMSHIDCEHTFSFTKAWRGIGGMRVLCPTCIQVRMVRRR